MELIGETIEPATGIEARRQLREIGRKRHHFAPLGPMNLREEGRTHLPLDCSSRGPIASHIAAT